MQVRDFALRILQSERLDEKLAPLPAGVEDSAPGPPRVVLAPARSAELRIRASGEAKVPAIAGMVDPDSRARIVHSFANHELQAVELNAWALLAFPRAPGEFRRGLLEVLADEQRHTRLYSGVLRRLGSRFGAFPVSGYFWNKVPRLTTPLRYVSAMALTFENANLDHTIDYAAAARAAGDASTARVIDAVHADEIRHVRFGWRWLAELKEPSQSMWEAYCASVVWPLRAALARGATFHVEGRVAAGLDPEFIRLLGAAERDVSPEARPPRVTGR